MERACTCEGFSVTVWHVCRYGLVWQAKHSGSVRSSWAWVGAEGSAETASELYITRPTDLKPCRVVVCSALKRLGRVLRAPEMKGPNTNDVCVDEDRLRRAQSPKPARGDQETTFLLDSNDRRNVRLGLS